MGRLLDFEVDRHTYNPTENRLKYISTHIINLLFVVLLNHVTSVDSVIDTNLEMYWACPKKGSQVVLSTKIHTGTYLPATTQDHAQ